mgnify:CR=1 FL=1
MSLGRTATLPNGCKLPLLGYGTWLSKPGEVEDGVFKALEVGYRHLVSRPINCFDYIFCQLLTNSQDLAKM